jgi:hypothetical protein
MYSFLKHPGFEIGIDINMIGKYQELLNIQSRGDGNGRGNQLTAWLEFRKEYFWRMNSG